MFGRLMKTLGKARVDKIEWNPFLFETPLFLNLSFPCLKPLWQLTYKPTCWTGEKVTVAFVKSTRHWENEFVPVWVLVCLKIPFAGSIQSRQGDHCGCDQHLSADVFTRRRNNKKWKEHKVDQKMWRNYERSWAWPWIWHKNLTWKAPSDWTWPEIDLTIKASCEP